MKKIIHQLHLWLGLGVAIFLFLICLSGTILTFENEIKSILNPISSFEVPVNSSRMKLEELISSTENKSKGKVVFVVTEQNHDPVTLTVKSNPEERRGKSYILNPYNGEVLNNPNERPGFFMFFFRLHRWLLLEMELGRIVVGVSTLIMTFLLLSGLYLWLPKNRAHFKNSLKIKFKSSWKRINYDLHNTLGFYSMPFLLVMSLTGLCWSFEWYRDLGSKALGAKIFDRSGRPERIEVFGERKSLEELYVISQSILTFPGKTYFMVPINENNPVSFLKTRTGFFTLSTSDRLSLHPVSGDVISHDKFSDKKLGAQIASMVKALHVGDFMGGFSKIIYFITCLIGTSLPITGFYIWFNKRRKNA
jgi:uncharacterized iron-regulated membrane protein